MTAGIQATMATVDADISRRVPEKIVRHTAYRHEMETGRFERQCMIFSRLTPLTVTCIQKTERFHACFSCFF